ncbi:MAG: ribosome silencing factor [Acidobacteriota bacterium]
MEEIQEKMLHRESVKIEIPNSNTPFADIDDEVKLAIKCAADKKAVNMVALDLRDIASFTEFFVIASGTNQRQVQAIADEIREQLKKQLNSKAVRVEGYSSGEWVLLDFGDFIVHIFDKDAREFYDLERLWRDARRVELPKDSEI